MLSYAVLPYDVRSYEAMGAPYSQLNLKLKHANAAPLIWKHSMSCAILHLGPTQDGPKGCYGTAVLYVSNCT